MKVRTAVVAALCIGLVCGIAGAQAYAQGGKITVYNPMGTPPPIQMRAMAPRLNSIEGKTIYLVNTGFPNSDNLMAVLQEWFKDNHPKTNTVILRASMESLQPAQWEEIGAKADAVIYGVGH